MKKQILFFYNIILIGQCLFSAPQISPHTFLFCIKPEIQPLEISLNRGKSSAGMVELDDFFQMHKVVRVEPWIKSATVMDKDGDIFLNRIYRVYLDESRDLSIDQSISSISHSLLFYMQNLSIYGHQIHFPMIISHIINAALEL